MTSPPSSNDGSRAADPRAFWAAQTTGTGAEFQRTNGPFRPPIGSNRPPQNVQRSSGSSYGPPTGSHRPQRPFQPPQPVPGHHPSFRPGPVVPFRHLYLANGMIPQPSGRGGPVFPSSFPLLRQGANPDEGSAKPAEGDTELDMLVDVRPRDLLTSLHNSGHLDGLRKDLLNEFIYSDLGKEFKLFVDSIVRARVGAGQKTGLEASVVSSVEQGWGSVPGLKENVERWIRETAGTRVKGVVDKIAEDRIAEDRIKDAERAPAQPQPNGHPAAEDEKEAIEVERALNLAERTLNSADPGQTKPVTEDRKDEEASPLAPSNAEPRINGMNVDVKTTRSEDLEKDVEKPVEKDVETPTEDPGQFEKRQPEPTNDQPVDPEPNPDLSQQSPDLAKPEISPNPAAGSRDLWSSDASSPAASDVISVEVYTSAQSPGKRGREDEEEEERKKARAGD